MTARSLLPRLLLFIGILLVIIWVAFNRDRIDPETLDAWLSGLGLWAPVIFVGAYAVGAVLFLPGSLLTFAGGALFGPLWGAVLSLLGATLGASLAFLVARYLAGDWVARKAGGQIKRLIEGVESEGWRFVAFVRLVPLFPFNLTNYVLGLTRIKFVSYVLTSLVCMAPGAIAYTWIGHAGREALAGNASAIRYGLLALGLVAAIAFLPHLVKRLRQSPMSWIEPDELHSQLLAGNALTVLDVREPEEFTGPLGHITGAMNMPVDELPDRLSEIRAEKNQPVILVCRTDRRSAAAYEILHSADFKDLAVLRGGMERWNALEFAKANARVSGCQWSGRN